MVYRLIRTAEEQIDALLLDSAGNHGLQAAGRYGQLILTVMAAQAEERTMLGSVAVARLNGVRAYPTRLGRRRVEPARRVATPRHLVVYRLGTWVVLRLSSKRSPTQQATDGPNKGGRAK